MSGEGVHYRRERCVHKAMWFVVPAARGAEAVGSCIAYSYLAAQQTRSWKKQSQVSLVVRESRMEGALELGGATLVSEKLLGAKQVTHISFL